jgi:type II secretory pathway predicted ATPase ExeA
LYAQFYGFRSDPFHVTPDATRILLTKAHREAIGVLEYGLRVRKGFIVLSGEVGVGKTTVLRHSLRRLDPASSAIVYVVQPALTPHQLLSFIWEELSGETDPVPEPWQADAGELIRHLLFRLKALHGAGTLVVIVVDEAQTMPVETLESLRLLSNLESDKQKFLQIILAGQPELDAKLARHELRQLNQRIAVRARIGNLAPAEAFAYIRYRLETAAGRRIDIFTDEALAYIIAKSRGNPRRLNIFCDNALINGMGHRAPHVTLEIARDAIAPHLAAERGSPWSLPALLARLVARALPARQLAYASCVVIAAALVIGFGADLGSGKPAPPKLAWHARHDLTLTASLPDDETIADVRPDERPAPAITAPGAVTPPPPAIATYIIDSQDTLAQLCPLVYGVCSPRAMRTLAAANPQLDPLHLADGQIVRLPVIENLQPVVP